MRRSMKPRVTPYQRGNINSMSMTTTATVISTTEKKERKKKKSMRLPVGWTDTKEAAMRVAPARANLRQLTPDWCDASLNLYYDAKTASLDSAFEDLIKDSQTYLAPTQMRFFVALSRSLQAGAGPQVGSTIELMLYCDKPKGFVKVNVDESTFGTHASTRGARGTGVVICSRL